MGACPLCDYLQGHWVEPHPQGADAGGPPATVNSSPPSEPVWSRYEGWRLGPGSEVGLESSGASVADGDGVQTPGGRTQGIEQTTQTKISILTDTPSEEQEEA